MLLDHIFLHTLECTMHLPVSLPLFVDYCQVQSEVNSILKDQIEKKMSDKKINGVDLSIAYAIQFLIL